MRSSAIFALGATFGLASALPAAERRSAPFELDQFSNFQPVVEIPIDPRTGEPFGVDKRGFLATINEHDPDLGSNLASIGKALIGFKRDLDERGFAKTIEEHDPSLGKDLLAIGKAFLGIAKRDPGFWSTIQAHDPGFTNTAEAIGHALVGARDLDERGFAKTIEEHDPSLGKDLLAIGKAFLGIAKRDPGFWSTIQARNPGFTNTAEAIGHALVEARGLDERGFLSTIEAHDPGFTNTITQIGEAIIKRNEEYADLFTGLRFDPESKEFTFTGP